ncbi:MAG TPA: OmpA family protein, partial [Woeseiaceae bacterium]|nr:OmpA family protein [Woeseiaceae bacterium]
MYNHRNKYAKIIVSTAALAVLGACATPLMAPEGSESARNKLTQLQSDAQLSSRAQVEIKAAETAVAAAEVPNKDQERAKHLVLLADHKVDIARARAQSRLYEDERQALSEQAELARLQARTREADKARLDATAARKDAMSARADATAARLEADESRETTMAARLESEDLQRQIEELNARETDRGLVVTLGDLLFETGKSDLKGGAAANLNKLALFLGEYPDRSVLIEGHTDNVGSDETNVNLSQRRANSVQSYLVGQGIAAARLSTSGLGEGSPVAGNDTATGRQQNRRVEVIISNATTASR